MSKSAIVLSYAHWEGFYNECAHTYLRFLTHLNKPLSAVDWSLLLGLLTSNFESLRARNHSIEAKHDFVEKLSVALKEGARGYDTSVLLARSNLNFDKIKTNFSVLSFSYDKLQKYRLKIDNEVVGWRHGIAHGSDPDLSLLDLEKHLELVRELLLVMADIFQEEIMARTN